MKRLGPSFFNFVKFWKFRYLKNLSLGPHPLLPISQTDTSHKRRMDQEVINRISERTKQAEALVEDLKNDLALCRKAILESSVSDETKRIQAENERLKKDLEYWKTKLVQIEIQNKIEQISLPSDFSSCEKPAPVIPAIAEEPCKAFKLDGSNTNNGQLSTAGDIKGNKASKKEKKDVSKRDKPAKSGKTSNIRSDDSKEIDVSRLDLRIGRILSVKRHPDAESLYVEEIEVGEERPRTVVSGLVKFVPLEEMQDRLVVVLCNLKPAKMRGVLSEAMVMCASTPEKVEILIPPEGSVPGDRVVCEGFTGEPDLLLNPKKKIFEQVAPDLKTNENCIAAYRKLPLIVFDKGFVKAMSLSGVQIK